MQSCQFAKSVIERGSRKFSAARPAAVSSVELQYSRSRPCSLCFRNHSNILTMVCSRAAVLELANSVAPRAQPSNSTSTSRKRDRFLYFRLFCTFILR